MKIRSLLSLIAGATVLTGLFSSCSKAEAHDAKLADQGISNLETEQFNDNALSVQTEEQFLKRENTRKSRLLQLSPFMRITKTPSSNS